MAPERARRIRHRPVAGRQYWIDGYNVLHRLGLGAGHPWARRRDELAARVSLLGVSSWIVFDSREDHRGMPPGRTYRHVRVEYARDGRSADECILDRVAAAKSLAGVQVVTDDNEIVRGCRLHGVDAMSVAVFGRLLRPVERKKKSEPKEGRPLSRAEVDDWLRWFGIDPDDD